MLGLIRQEERRSGASVRVRDYCGPVEFLNGGIDQNRHENGYIYLDRDLTEEHLYLTGTETVNNTYESISTVSERIIPNPRVIDYISEEGIVLIPGFDVQDGATFLADIDTFPVTGLIYRYFIKDHLGSVRVEFEDSSNMAVMKSQHHFYPFGCEHQGSWNQDTKNNHLYTGQERQSSFNLEYLRFFYRQSDPLVLNRFDTPDPLADDPANINWSPYTSMWNNPVNVIDPDGAFNEYIGTIDENGDVSYAQTGDKGGDETDYITYVDSEGNQIDNVTVQVQTVNVAYGEMYQGSIDRIPGLNIINTGTGGAITPVASPIDYLFAGGAAKTTFGLLRLLAPRREKTQEHHSDPKFLGGDPNQPTTTMGESLHRALHSDLIIT